MNFMDWPLIGWKGGMVEFVGMENSLRKGQVPIFST